MNPVYDFKGQVALVTGAAKGMGLATARMFVQSGASVVLADLERRALAVGAAGEIAAGMGWSLP
jgi:NAD(P)-dependent dehydrogenase (short-subunit alcohol dehydrogenase family)